MYCLEGNQSVGKSTFLRLLKQHFSYIDIEYEPLTCWQKKRSGESLLGNFFNDLPRWAYTLDTFALMVRVREHLKQQNNPNKNRVFERSIYSGYYGYAYCDYTLGSMTNMEWALHNEWFDYLTKNCTPPLGFIYLRVDPDVAYKRSIKRNREEDKNAKLEFLTQLGNHHDNFLIHKKNIMEELKDVPVLILDCNQEFEKDKKVLLSHLDKVQQFMLDTQIQVPGIKKQQDISSSL